ncbi:MAG: KEOPS complex kinase/ATPase Bud32 [Candidatus Micrarchaeia archaeon]
MEKIGDGAEAVVYRSGNKALKQRPVKAYRHPALDETLRKSRTRIEARLLQKAKEKGIAVPALLAVDERAGTLELEFLAGKRLRDALNAGNAAKWCCEAGRLVSRLHSANIIHGDLTTSNFIVSRDALYVLDFGLAFSSHRFEDRAVDLHVFKEALESKHHEFWCEAWDAFLAGYKGVPETLRRLSVLEGRGRYKNKD